MTDRRDHTRAAIVEAAKRLMAEHGVRVTTIDQIAREAFVSVGAIYTHFANKVELVWYFVEVGLDDLASDMARAHDLASPADRVHAAGVAYLRFAIDHPIAARFAAVRVLDPEPAPEFVEANRACADRMRPIVAQVARDVRAAMEAGQLRDGPLDETVSALWGLWYGTTALMLRQDEFRVPEDVGRRAIELGHTALLTDAADRPAHDAPTTG